MKKEVETVVERALKGEKRSWQQRQREEVEEEETVFQIRNSLEQGITKFMGTATPTNRQGAIQQVQEGGNPVKLVHSSLLTVCNEGVREKFCCGLDGCSAKFVKRGHLRNHMKKVHGVCTSEKLGDPPKSPPPSEEGCQCKEQS